MSTILYRKQRRILEFLREFIEREGFAPTIREIAEGVGNNSPATIEEHLQALERKGVIKRTKGKKRSISIKSGFKEPPRKRIPILGQITAGEPLEAIEDKHRYVEFTPSQPLENLYALKVSGNSMIEDGILDGDTVIIRKQQTCNDGEVVVAFLDDGSATLKRLYREKNRIRLQPANSEFNPIYVNQLQIQGVVVGLVRRFDA